MNIKATVIDGNAKNSIYDIGVIARNTDHAWNAIYFNEQWNLIDATWSTGNEDDKPNYFDFDDSYYCIAPEKIIMSHFPKNPKWQLLTKKISKKQFYTRPLIYAKYINLNLSLDPTTRGTTRVKSTGFVELKFDIIDTTKVYYYAFKEDAYSTKLELIKVGKQYVAKIPFKGRKRDYLSLYSNTEAFLSFKIIPTR
jgi:transglutaminase/protease-like cytokinesis protein 3